MKARYPLTIISICLAIFICVTSCRERVHPPVDKGKLKIITTLFPLYDFARNVGGEQAHVTLILPPGLEPHSFEPKPGDVIRINDADIFVYTDKKMEPWVENILKSIDNKKLLVINASKGITLLSDVSPLHGCEKTRQGEPIEHHPEDKLDPHIWLDLTNVQNMVDNIRDGFISKDPSGKNFYMKNTAQYGARLSALDREFKTSLSNCRHRLFVHGGHFAFNYLAKHYNLAYVSAYQGSPDAEPSPRKIMELKKLVKDNEVKYIYYEELITPRVAEMLARETGADLLFLHGAHNISKDDLEKGTTFISIMEQNLTNLMKGLECR
ncbi:MAG: metal ABC transporter substrate-binding protein [Syntrophobacterales bacterium]|jgi:zinc transport system substrate-binding protein|nr:metal ABC transporter substrate-binding protein [Syntrophobacterales bacterium]